ncbi:MAG: hypothetical protein JW863_14970 [Chitinispirillaceae bacterium]|nr:hypothetical protein [Chitinispirillaceae bacterium]
MSTYKFTYTTINGAELGNDYKKSLLTGVETYNGTGTALLSKTQFTYNTDFAKGNIDDATNYDPDYNYGAISGISTSTGGNTQLQYIRKELDLPKIAALPPLSIAQGLSASMTTDGFSYITVRQGNQKDILSIYNWNGSNWYESYQKTNLAPGPDGIVVIARGNHVFIRQGEKEDCLRIFTWKNEKWIESFPMQDLTSGDDMIDINPGIDFVVVRQGGKKDCMSIYSWNGDDWIETLPFDDFTSGDDGIEMYPGNNYVAVRQGGKKDCMRIYSWNGSIWAETFPMTDLTTNDDAIDIFPVGNNVIVRQGDNKDCMSVYSWDGQNWVISFPFDDLTSLNDGIDIYPFDENNFAVRQGDKKDCMRVYSWDGQNWVTSFPFEDLTTGDDGIDIYPGDKCFAVRQGGKKDCMRIYNANEAGWTEKFPMQDLTSLDDQIDIYTTKNYLIARHGGKKDMLHIFIWDGKSWNFYNDILPLAGAEELQVAVGPSFFGVGSDKAANIGLWFKFQDIFEAPVYSYTVSQKVVDPSVSSSKISTSLEFDGATGNYDTRAGTAKFNKVEMLTPANGKTVQYYYNDTHADSQHTVNANYEKMDGMVYRTVAYSQANAATETNPRSTGSTKYSLYSNASWPPDVYQKRVDKTTGTTQGVTTANEILDYNNSNGLPFITRRANSDGKQLLSATLFACDDDEYASAFWGAYMLSAPLYTITYEKEKGDASVSWSTPEIRSVKKISYKNTLGCDAWLPEKTYLLRADFKDDGTVDDISTMQLNQSFERYSVNGLLLETSKPTNSGNLYSSTIYGYNGTLPVASAINSHWAECGVLTCNYQNNIGHPDYLDYENGWEKGVACDPDHPLPTPSVTMNNKGHFGDSSVYVVNAFGPTRNFKLTKGRDYEMTAWVNVKSGTAWMHGDFRRITKTSDNTWPVPVAALTKETGVDFPGVQQASTDGKWVLIKMKIPAATLLATKNWDSNNWYARVFVGAVNYTGGEVYIDDIRFAPVDAMMSSSYYDQKWRQPIISIDANNNPGKKVEYDGFGRPVRWYKFDKTNPSNLTLVQKKEYHLMGEGDVTYSNNYETGNIDWGYGGGCATTPSIFTGGYNSGHCLKVSKPATCFAYTGWTGTPYINKMCVYKGYYLSPSPLEVGAYAMVSGGTEVWNRRMQPACNQ